MTGAGNRPGREQKIMFMAVSRINNPKSKNNGMWVVLADSADGHQMETVFMHKSKKSCIEYAKAHSEEQHITNGIEYGARF